MTAPPPAGAQLGALLTARFPAGLTIGDTIDADPVAGNALAMAALESIHDAQVLGSIAKTLDAGVCIVIIDATHPLGDELAGAAAGDMGTWDYFDGIPWALLISDTGPPPPAALILDPLANGPMPAGWQPGDPKPEAGR